MLLSFILIIQLLTCHGYSGVYDGDYEEDSDYEEYSGGMFGNLFDYEEDTEIESSGYTSPPIPSINECPQMNANLKGRSNTMLIANVTSVGKCADICDTNGGCNAWIWHHEGAGRFKHRCILVERFSEIVADEKAIIGMKSCQIKGPEIPTNTTIIDSEEDSDEDSEEISEEEITTTIVEDLDETFEKIEEVPTNDTIIDLEEDFTINEALPNNVTIIDSEEDSDEDSEEISEEEITITIVEDLDETFEKIEDLDETFEKIEEPLLIPDIPECPKWNSNLQAPSNSKKINNVYSWKHCAQRCLDDGKCNAWVWYHEHSGQYKFICTLVENFTSTIRDNNSFVGSVHCQASEIHQPEECVAPLSIGNCKGAMPRWYYNMNSSMCEQFLWGGCHGGNNMFNTKEDCIKTCNLDICNLPAETGNCRANFQMWYYNSIVNDCQQFTYGGCGGNENKFTSDHNCQLACGSKNGRDCDLGDNFALIGTEAITHAYRESDWFMSRCEGKCRAMCLKDHKWGSCLAYSIKNKWYGCNCYIFDQAVSKSMSEAGTNGHTFNRSCE